MDTSTPQYKAAVTQNGLIALMPSGILSSIEPQPGWPAQASQSSIKADEDVANEACPVLSHHKRWLEAWEWDCAGACGRAGSQCTGLPPWWGVLISLLFCLGFCLFVFNFGVSPSYILGFFTLLWSSKCSVVPLLPLSLVLLWKAIMQGSAAWHGAGLRAAWPHGLPAAILPAMWRRQSRWAPLLSWPYWLCVWQTRTDGEGCFAGKEHGDLLDLLS